jgi:hypothetical protein
MSYNATNPTVIGNPTKKSDFDTLWNNVDAVKAIADAALKNIVEDTTPQLGGDLDLNGHQITALREALWTKVPTANFTAAPSSTSELAMGVDMTAAIKVDVSLWYVIGGVSCYGQVAVIAADKLTVRGAPLSGPVTALYYGGGTMAKPAYDASVNADGTANTTALKTGTVYTVTWRGPKSYVVSYSAKQSVHDSGTHGKFTLKIGGDDVNTSAGGLVIAANATEYKTDINIDVTKYDINDGEDLTAVVTQGSSVNGYGLRWNAVIITP